MVWRWLLFALFLTGGSVLFADEPAPVAVVDALGKEHKLTGLKLTAGTRRLAFLADPKGTTEESKKGPLAFELREMNSTTFAKGVVTLIPLACVESVKYDFEKRVGHEKPSMTVSVKGQKELLGTLEFRGINTLAFEGKTGDGSSKFSGGGKDSIRSISWPVAKPLPSRPASSMAWSVQIVQLLPKDPELTVRNIKTLYSFPGGTEQLLDAIPVRKGEPLTFDAKLKSLEWLAVDSNTQMAAVEVLVEGSTERLLAVPLTLERDKRIGTLIGLVGEVDHGWKLFPLHAIKQLKPVK